MKVVAHLHSVQRWTRQDYSGYQILYRVTCIFGVPIWRTEIDREEVPMWANVQNACFGSTEWKSRLFKQYAYLLPG